MRGYLEGWEKEKRHRRREGGPGVVCGVVWEGKSGGVRGRTEQEHRFRSNHFRVIREDSRWFCLPYQIRQFAPHFGAKVDRFNTFQGVFAPMNGQTLSKLIQFDWYFRFQLTKLIVLNVTHDYDLNYADDAVVCDGRLGYFKCQLIPSKSDLV